MFLSACPAGSPWLIRIQFPGSAGLAVSIHKYRIKDTMETAGLQDFFWPESAESSFSYSTGEGSFRILSIGRIGRRTQCNAQRLLLVCALIGVYPLDRYVHRLSGCIIL